MASAKILLVDDTRLFLELEKNFLRLSPVRVLVASSGEEALEIARKERPDLIFMDVHMPGMGGISCCGQLKNDPSLKAIPVVMVTASAKDEDLEHCRQAGCDDYVTKPVERKIFLEKARKFLTAVDRRESRVNCRVEAACRHNGQFVIAEIVDISLGGAYLQSVLPVSEKDPMSITFVLSSPLEATIETKGQIAWINSRDHRKKPSLPPGFGVEFVDMEEASRSAIRTYVETHR